MTDLRCPSCDALLAKKFHGTSVEIRCRKCKTDVHIRHRSSADTPAIKLTPTPVNGIRIT